MDLYRYIYIDRFIDGFIDGFIYRWIYIDGFIDGFRFILSWFVDVVLDLVY